MDEAQTGVLDLVIWMAVEIVHVGVQGILVVLLGGFIWAAAIPFKTLSWWAGWRNTPVSRDAIVPGGRSSVPSLAGVPHGATDSYILFFSGVGSASSQTMSFRERNFLRHLHQLLPHSVIVDDLFPFSVNNISLTEQRYFAGFWRWALHCKRHGPALFGALINLHNIFQLCTSIDGRYGPIYNGGVATFLHRVLQHHGYKPHSNTPVILVASSGAAQIALGAVTPLKAMINAPVYVITFGGVFGSDVALNVVDHFYHIYGTRDVTVPWGWLDSRRWPLRRGSAWNGALRAGRATPIPLPGIHHKGPRGYLDFRHRLPDGRTQVECTADLVAGLVQRHVPVPTAEKR